MYMLLTGSWKTPRMLSVHITLLGTLLTTQV